MSQVNVNTIANVSGTSAATIDSNGDLSITGKMTQPAKPAFRVFKRASSGVGGASGDVTFNNVSFNIGSHWDTSNNYFVAPVAGIYLFNLIAYGVDSDGSARTANNPVAVNVQKYTGGSYDIQEEYYGKINSDSYIPMSFSSHVQLAANERVKYNVRVGYLYYDTSTTYDYLVLSGHMVG